MVLANRLRAVTGAPACARCSRLGKHLCDSCARSLSPAATPTIAGAAQVLAAWEYEGAARSLVLDLKLRGLRSTAGPLVAATVATVRAAGLSGSVVAWVPGRRRDIRRRGFDHAAELATGLARALGLPLVGALTRRADPPDQTTLGAGERRANVAGAFAATGCTERVVLVDDLITTGATATECVRVLRDYAPSVEVVAPCARGR
ncbi:MAG: hypothetical protein GEU71_01305 [Actinobacteria bacterium]|nr:hypothetical protein [Actinomycetota bacterium]